ncbi:MAG: CBS domain-containing protein [Bacteroidota bacterium]
MNLKAPVSSLMTVTPMVVAPTDKMKQAKELFDTHQIHHLPVVHDERLVGILSKTDLLYFLRLLHQESSELYLNDIRLKNYKVEEVMTKRVFTVSSTDTIEKVLEIFTENLFHALPVVDGGKLVGIITTHDILFRLLHPKKMLTAS